MASRTVTFLFTDIEGSTRLWEESPEAMRIALARHDALMREAIAAHGGETFKTVGDAFCAAFEDAPAAAAATLAAQTALAGEPWPTPRPIRVRMALHTGTAEVRDGDYYGPPLNRVARLLSTGHGGQTLLSSAFYELVRDLLPDGAFLVPLGEHRLKDLARPETVHGLLHPTLASEFPPLRSLGSATLPNNLPEQTTSFVGREDELRRVAQELSRTRFLTLTGPGGTGKTRLALQAAAEAIDAFPGGVWLVEFASLENPGLVSPTVAGVLGVTEEAGKPLVSSLAERLRDAPVLLVFDNCEHVLDATARLADALVRSAPTLRVLATSREPLGVAGETVHRVPTLSLPKREAAHTAESLGHFEAVHLFVERAVAQKGDFTVTNANAPSLASLCLRLDGIPLAIELAAARVRSLTVEQIEARLDDRFRLLTGGARTALPRQQTLRALVDWSYDLLDDAERTVLRRLAVFAGGWTLEAAETVVAGEGIEDWEVLDLLSSLVDKSLVAAETTGSAVRFEMLEMVRQYAQERLRESGEEADAVARHTAFFVELSEKKGARSRNDGEAMRELTRDLDNLRAAFDRGTPVQKLEMTATLWRFWTSLNVHREGMERAREALAGTDALLSDEQTRYDATYGGANLAEHLFENEIATKFLEEAVSLARRLGDPERLAVSLGFLAGLHGSDDLARARSLYEEALTVKPTFPTTINLVFHLTRMGEIEAADRMLARAEALLTAGSAESAPYYQMFRHLAGCDLRLAEGKATLARAELDEAARLAEELDNVPVALDTRLYTCYLRKIEGHVEEACSIALEIVSDARQSRNRDDARVTLARLALALGRTPDASAALFEIVPRAEPLQLIPAVEATAAFLESCERWAQATRLLGAAARLRLVRSMRLPPVDLAEHEERLDRLRHALGETFAATFAEGEALDADAFRAEAIAALDSSGL